MRNIVLLAVIPAFLAACAASPQSDAEYAAAKNADPRVWPPYDPNSAFPDQIMDGESRSGSRNNSRGGYGRDSDGGRGGGGRR